MKFYSTSGKKSIKASTVNKQRIASVTKKLQEAFDIMDSMDEDTYQAFEQVVGNLYTTIADAIQDLDMNF